MSNLVSQDCMYCEIVLFYDCLSHFVIIKLVIYMNVHVNKQKQFISSRIFNFIFLISSLLNLSLTIFMLN